MSKQKIMSFDEWIEEFKPIKNLIDTNSSYDGLMHETYGKELEFVSKENSQKIWTLVDTDNGVEIISGFHHVNRIGYFVTENSVKNQQIISVVDDPKKYIRQMVKDGYIRNNDPYQNFDLSVELNIAWLDTLKKTRKPK